MGRGGGGNGTWPKEELEDYRVHAVREDSRAILGRLSALAQHIFDFWGLMDLSHCSLHSHWILVTTSVWIL